MEVNQHIFVFFFCLSLPLPLFFIIAFRPIQERFYDEAEALAEKVDTLSVEDAEAQLTAFMSNISFTIRDTLLYLNKTLS